MLKRVVKTNEDMLQVVQKATTVLEEPINNYHPRIKVNERKLSNSIIKFFDKIILGLD